MIDFACKRFKMEEIIKCAFALTRTEYQIFLYILKNEVSFTTFDLAKKLNLNITTIQKAMKKFYEKDIVYREQLNLEKGGYIFYYKIKTKKYIKEIIKKRLDFWVEHVKKNIDSW